MKKIIVTLLLATGVCAENGEDDFVTYTVSQKHPVTISIKATPLTKDPIKRMLPPLINLLGDGMIIYNGEKCAVTIEAKIMQHENYWVVNEREGNKQLTDWLLRTLDDKVLPIFTKLAKKVKEDSEIHKQVDMRRAKELFGTESINAESWLLPMGYALAEELKITLPQSPKRIMLFYQQNLYGLLHRREKNILLMDEYSICISYQKKIEEAIKKSSADYGNAYQATAEDGTDGFTGMLKRLGALDEEVKETFGGLYFSDNHSNVWCTKHMPPSVTPETIKEKCAWQQHLVTKFLDMHFVSHKIYPNLSNKAEADMFGDEWNCLKLLHEPANSYYLNDSSGQIRCAVHGRLD